MATNGGNNDNPFADNTPELGSVFFFEELHELMAQGDWSELYLNKMLADPEAMAGWFKGLEPPDDVDIVDHVHRHIGPHPLFDAIAAGAWLALARSAKDHRPPRVYLRVSKAYEVTVGRSVEDGGIDVVINVTPVWPHLPMAGGKWIVNPDAKVLESLAKLAAGGTSFTPGWEPLDVAVDARRNLAGVQI